MLLHITDTINQTQAVEELLLAPDDEPIPYTLTPEALALIDGK